MGLKKILILAGTGLAVFLVFLVLGWKINAPAAAAASEPNHVGAEATDKAYINPLAEKSGEQVSTMQRLSEKQLESLIFELREKIKETKKKEADLALQEDRMNTASEEIKADIEKLNSLRTELAGTMAQIKQEREAIGKDRVNIAAAEVVKLQQIASIHDKMDPASGASLLLSMATNGRIDDAVQILNFMQERNAAKVLAEMVAKEPKVATALCEKLKKIRQEGGK